jgi:hypothetical protein
MTDGNEIFKATVCIFIHTASDELTVTDGQTSEHEIEPLQETKKNQMVLSEKRRYVCPVRIRSLAHNIYIYKDDITHNKLHVQAVTGF